ncbi:MAG: hypothetical protein CMP36_01260 [Rickettsiales bacterium]|nr:hypothetical protein [Rickettsiales bacterium]OUV82331.1 MAG: hypothetical protein CBC91_01680 [Rickettsiales bacterium TMED131]|tara:strand:+ start:2284 stop:3426 length:1143 start_codon:yes stop_codon:yes gene_type:complete
MKKNKIIDFVVLGGGCAALSFINKVIDKKIKNFSFVIIEKRKKYYDDKSWCFWTEDKKQYDKILEKSWRSFSFNFKDKNNILTSNSFEYIYIRSISFYNFVISKISSKPFIELKLNEDVINIKFHKSYYQITTSRAVYLAKNVLDTRPNIDNFKKNPFMYQSFLGYEIKFKKQIDFNINNVYLMHNMKADNKKFFFDYILPINKNTVLFEHTIFSKNAFSEASIKKMLTRRLKIFNNNEFKVIRKEYGKIPMGIINKKALIDKNNYFFTGTLAGAIRPSSGYGFLNIQSWADQTTNKLKEEGKINSYFNNKVIEKYLDNLFLKIISNNSIYAPYIFYYFTKNIITETFIRFMIGNASFFDFIKVIYAMPKRVFIRCLIKN